MIHSIALEGFKCFRERNQIPLSQINVMYGKNGRGKST
ncbi:AAA family ATPase, partial [Bacteroides ovatus]